MKEMTLSSQVKSKKSIQVHHMVNSRVVNPYTAVFAAVSVACVIGPFVVVRGKVNADNAPYWCNRNSIDPTDKESTRILHDVLTDLANTTGLWQSGGGETYFTTGGPIGGCCGPYSCDDSMQNSNTNTGLQTLGFCYHAKCNGGTACAQCVAAAGQALVEACKSSIGGQIQVQECRIRYEAYGFKE